MPTADQVFSWLVNSTLSAGIVLTLGAMSMVTVVQPASRQRLAEWTLGAALAVALLLAVPGLPRMELELLNTAPSGDRDTASRAATAAKPELAARVRHVSHVDLGVKGSEPTGDELILDSSARASNIAPETVSSPSKRRRAPAVSYFASVHWQQAAIAIYFLGGILFLFRLGAGWIGLWRMVRSASPPAAEIFDIWNAFNEARPTKIRLLVSPSVTHPFAFGIVRPLILIPTTLCEPGRRPHLMAVIRHELAHVARRDVASWMLANLAQPLLYHQPLYWLVRRQLRFSQECIADAHAAYAAGSTADYAQALTELATELNRPSHLVPHGIGVFRSGSDLYRRIQVLSRNEAAAPAQSGRALNFLAAFTFGLSIVALSLLPFCSAGNASQNSVDGNEQGTFSTQDVAPAENRAWYIMRQPNTTGLFHGLPQRMEAFSTGTSKSSYTWEGSPGRGCNLRLNLRVESKVGGDVFVGFFADPRWWVSPPEQVRRFPGQGSYLVEGIPAGSYFIGATSGTLAGPIAVGVEASWPQAVKVEVGAESEARVLVSDEFTWFDHIHHPRDYVGDWPKLDPVWLVKVRAVDTQGSAVPYCRVTYLTSSTDFSQSTGTEHDGFAYRDDIRDTFSIAAQRNSFDPVTLASRYQYRRFPGTHRASDHRTIRLVWEPFPTGAGSVTGRVRAHNGRPVTEFHIGLTREDGDGDRRQSIGLRVPFIHSLGRFQVSGLAPGEYSITAMAFDYPTHVYQTREEQQRFTITPGEAQAARVDIELQARDLRYGRAVFDNSAAVPSGTWSSPSRGAFGFDRDGTFRVALSEAEQEEVTSLEGGMIQLKARGRDGQQGSTTEVDWNELSTDPTQPTVVTIPVPPSLTGAEEPRITRRPDNADAILRLKQLGAYVKLREDGTVAEVSFLDSQFGDADAVLLRKLPNIEKLRFDRTPIGDTTLAQVSELPNLRELELPGGDITDFGVSHLEQTPTLWKLNLRGTKITDMALLTVASLSHLKELDVARTKISNEGLKHLAGHRNLKSLFCTETNVTDEGLGHIAQMRQLEELVLSRLPITNDGLRRIAGLVNLIRLQLYGSQITDEGLKHLQQMTKLSHLDLGGTAISDEGLAQVEKLSRLERLHVSNARVTDAGLVSLRGLPELRVLYVAPNVTDAGLGSLVELPKLEVLGIGGPGITDVGLERIGQMRGLTNLFLDGANISDASIPHLIRLRKLLLLSVQRTRITAGGMKGFYSSFSRPPQVFGPQ